MLKILNPNPILSTIVFKIYYKASKMANYASQPKHSPTTSIWQYGSGKTPHQLKIAAWNVNGFRSILKKGYFQNYLLQNNPDIICINQTKIDFDAYKKQKKSMKQLMENVCQTSLTNQENKQKLFGDWFQYWNFCKVSSGYSGVLTLSKHKPIKSIQDFNLKHHLSFQGRCLTLQYEKFYLINIYKPYSGLKLSRLQQRTQIYDKSFIQFVIQLKKTKPVIVCGDMNVAHHVIDIARLQYNQKYPGLTKQQRQAFTKLLNQGGLIDSYRHLYPNKVEFTWWSQRLKSRQSNLGLRIDYMLFTNDKMIKQARIKGQILGSDHCPIQCQVKLQ